MDRHRRAWVGHVAAIAAASMLAGASASASAAGDHGPLSCLDGYVWRQATPRDHVCVTPAVRAQTARDNALAPSRRSATPGTFGPDLCTPGYVWREAVPGDHVCVTPAIWQQVHDDNLTAGARRNALRVKVGGHAATRTYWVHADGINVGVARVALFWPGRTRPALSWPVVAHRSAKGPGGELSFDTRLPMCAAHPDAIVRVRDPSSLRWSSSRRIAMGCTSA
ncbi:MAG: hypothetical protein ACXVFM_20920 [Solirubrobacteraceae bacterium]